MGSLQATSEKTILKSKIFNKKTILIVISALVCLAIIISVIPRAKSPEELLLSNDWYEISVGNFDYDWIGDGTGDTEYYFYAECYKFRFHSDGECEKTYYKTPGEYGPFSYEINENNMPRNIEWGEKKLNNVSWEILDEKTLVYYGKHYLWDDEKETHCDCDDCDHRKTWYITKEYLRIGGDTYTSKKPDALSIDD